MMTRSEAITKIAANLPKLSDESIQVLAEIAQSWAGNAAQTDEDDATRTAINKGIAQGRRGEFASDAEVAEAFRHFRE